MGVAQIIVYIVVALCVFAGVLVDILYNPKGYSLRFRFRRLANWLPLSISYAFFYIARYNITWIVDPRIADKLSITETQYGHILTAGFWTYALSAPFTGLVTDKQFGMKRGFYIGCFGSGLTLSLMGLVFLNSDSFSPHTSTLLFALFNSVDFIFQGFGTNAVSKINAAWYSSEERSLFGGIFSMITSTGLFINLIIGDFILNSYRFNYLFVFTGIILVVLGGFVILLVDTSPSGRWNEDLKLRNDTPVVIVKEENSQENSSQKMEIKEKLFLIFSDYIKPLCISPIRYTMLGFFVVGYLRESLLTWFVRFLIQERGVVTGDILYTVTSAGLSLASMGGAFLLGIISTLLFKSQYAPTIAIFFGLLSGVTMLLLIKNATITVVLLLVYFVLLFGVSNTLVFTVLMDFAKLKSVAFSGGLATTVQYIASGFSGFLNGFVISNYGFSSWIAMLLPFGIAGMFLMGIVAYEERKKAKTQINSVEIMMEEKASLVKEAAVMEDTDYEEEQL